MRKEVVITDAARTKKREKTVVKIITSISENAFIGTGSCFMDYGQILGHASQALHASSLISPVLETLVYLHTPLPLSAVFFM